MFCLFNWYISNDRNVHIEYIIHVLGIFLGVYFLSVILMCIYTWLCVNIFSCDSHRIYECNAKCHCNSNPQHCANRVVQRGIQHRLQVFRSTVLELAWGVRALDDIPQGSFVCSYVGRIYTEEESDKVYARGNSAVYICWKCMC